MYIPSATLIFSYFQEQVQTQQIMVLLGIERLQVIPTTTLVEVPLLLKTKVQIIVKQVLKEAAVVPSSFKLIKNLLTQLAVQAVHLGHLT